MKIKSIIAVSALLTIISCSENPIRPKPSESDIESTQILYDDILVIEGVFESITRPDTLYFENRGYSAFQYCIIDDRNFPDMWIERNEIGVNFKKGFIYFINFQIGWKYRIVLF